MKRIPKSVPAVEDKTRSSSPPPRALPGTTRPRWPTEPQECQTAIWFLGSCHHIEMEEPRRNFKRFILEWYQTFSGEKGDGLDLWWMRTQITYWLQRCDHERRGAPLSESFWNNYDAAMGGHAVNFDPVIRDILESHMKEEEKKMATTTAAPVKKPLPIPAQKPVAKVAAPAPVKKAAPPAKVAAPTKVAAAPKKAIVPAKREKTTPADGCPFHEGSARAKVYAICKRVKSQESAEKLVKELGDKNATKGTIKFVREVCEGHFGW